MSAAPPETRDTAQPTSGARRRRGRRRAGAPRRRRLLAVAGALVLLGVAALAARLWLMPYPGPAHEDSVRRLDMRITWQAERAGAELRLATPLDTRHARALAFETLHPGMRVQRLRRADGTRELLAVANRAGLFHLSAGFDMHLLARGHGDFEPARTLTSSSRERYLATEPGIDLSDPGVAQALRAMTLEGGLAGIDAAAVFRHVVESVDDAPDSAADGAAQALAQGRGTALGQARTFTALARAAGIPARVVTGFLLDPPRDAAPHHWAEAWSSDRWHAYDPSQGRSGSVPAWYVPVRRGGVSQVVRIEDGTLVRAHFAVSHVSRPQGLPGDAPPFTAVLDLTRLTADTRDALAIMLLLPFGVLINLVFRSLLRVRTYGTFSATLLALAATAVDWLTAVVLFALVTGIGVAGRALMPGLAMSRTPRLSLVFVLVVASATLAISAMHLLETGVAAAGVLIPMVVLTTLTDRVYATADEQGLRTALVRLAWTAVVAALAFVVFLSDDLGQWLLRHPEVHLITAATMLVVTAFARRERSATAPSV